MGRYKKKSRIDPAAFIKTIYQTGSRLRYENLTKSKKGVRLGRDVRHCHLSHTHRFPLSCIAFRGRKVPKYKYNLRSIRVHITCTLCYTFKCFPGWQTRRFSLYIQPLRIRMTLGPITLLTDFKSSNSDRLYDVDVPISRRPVTFTLLLLNYPY